MILFDLIGKVVFVIGFIKGIGEVIVYWFVEYGVKVVVFS